MDLDFKTVVEGAETTATVMTDDYDEACIDQIAEMVDHPAFQQPVAVMPDTHYGAGAVIGFTMPVGSRVVPNTIGVDIGCGMYAVNLGKPDRLVAALGNDDAMLTIDRDIRAALPMGYHVHDRADYHMRDDFPWDVCERKLESFSDRWGYFDGSINWFDGYGLDYFTGLCERVGYDPGRCINSMGTLGGGNHFVELAESTETGDYWCVIHSGSRGIGLKIANYWQDRATEYQQVAAIRDALEPWMTPYLKFDPDTVADDDLRQWVFGGKGEAFYDMKAVAADFEGEAIETRRQALKAVIPDAGKGHPLDYLEGSDAYGYFIDMVFAQTYASESRKQMTATVVGVLGAEISDTVESVHNYVDFEDTIIRKGATSAHAGERGIVPLNMRAGSLIIRGKGNREWNYSAPHGAGRRMSRTRAFNELDMADFEDVMTPVFSTSVTEKTLDEAPMAYKDVPKVINYSKETATIEDRLWPVHSLKAEE